MRHQTKPRILIFSGVRGDTRRYRTLHLWEQARLLNYDCCLTHLVDPLLSTRVEESWDFIILHRVAFDRYVKRLIDRARAHGACILFDVDDLVFDISAFRFINSPDFADPLRKSLYLETMQRFRQTFMDADGVIASTHYLAEVCSKLGKPVWIHRNAFSMEMLRWSDAARAAKSKSSDRIVIGYASGTATHNHDFALVKPALRKLLATFPQLDLRIIGPLDSGNDWEGTENRITHLPLVPWRNLPNCLAHFDINLAPLVLGNPFSQSKSEIKYMEAAMVQVPTVSSPTDSFSFAIRSGVNGFHAQSEQEWEDLLRLLVKNGGLRKLVGETACQEVIERYHPVTRALEFQELLQEISLFFQKDAFLKIREEDVQQNSAQFAVQPDWMPLQLEHDPRNEELGLYSLRHRGIKTLAQQAWIFFRRLVSPIFPYPKM